MRNIPLNSQWFAIRLLHAEMNFFLLLFLAMIRVPFRALGMFRTTYTLTHTHTCLPLCVHIAYVDRIVFWLVIFFSFIYFAICSVVFFYPHFIIVGLTVAAFFFVLIFSRSIHLFLLLSCSCCTSAFISSSFGTFVYIPLYGKGESWQKKSEAEKEETEYVSK